VRRDALGWRGIAPGEAGKIEKNLLKLIFVKKITLLTMAVYFSKNLSFLRTLLSHFSIITACYLVYKNGILGRRMENFKGKGRLGPKNWEPLM
jgi:hypothetical protein